MSDSGLRARHNADDGIVDSALAGADIRIFLQPDETIEARKGEATYIEVLEVPHVIVRGGAMWACQRNLVARSAGRQHVGKNYFSYYTGLDVFANSAYPDDMAVAKTVKTQLMSTGRYKELRWAARGAFEPVYDSDAPDETAALVEAVHACARFKLRIDFAEGHCQIHPVIYPFHYPETDEIGIETEMQFFPDFMRRGREDFIELLGENAEIFRDHTDPALRERGLTVATSAFSGFYRIFKRARGQRVFDLAGDDTQRFARTIVFAEA